LLIAVVAKVADNFIYFIVPNATPIILDGLSIPCCVGMRVEDIKRTILNVARPGTGGVDVVRRNN